jgi:hypothetical protein
MTGLGGSAGHVYKRVIFYVEIPTTSLNLARVHFAADTCHGSTARSINHPTQGPLIKHCRLEHCFKHRTKWLRRNARVPRNRLALSNIYISNFNNQYYRYVRSAERGVG